MGLLHCYNLKKGVSKKNTLCYIATLLHCYHPREKVICYIAHCYNLKKRGFPKKRPPATLLLCYNSSCLKKKPLCYIATLLQSSRKTVLLNCYIATISKKWFSENKIPPATFL